MHVYVSHILRPTIFRRETTVKWSTAGILCCCCLLLFARRYTAYTVRCTRGGLLLPSEIVYRHFSLVDQLATKISDTMKNQSKQLAKVTMELLKRQGIFEPVAHSEFYKLDTGCGTALSSEKGCDCNLSSFFLGMTHLYVRILLVFRARRESNLQREKAYGSDKWSTDSRRKRKYADGAGQDEPSHDQLAEDSQEVLC